ncbi:MAG: TonB-dependent receptor [Verrucomicrobiota bacterium]|nr:TonB-dependent receptor [Verrucomicrobiota bacterium]
MASAAQLKKLTLEELMNVKVTSVSRMPEKLFETASPIQVITQDDIRRSGAASLPEALRLASNLEVAQVDSRQWAISARGFNNTLANKMLVLIDGRTVYTPLDAGVFWDVQDTLLEDIDQIEVISGPGATQWGANAVNGVINIVTKSAKDTQGGLLFGGGGTEERGFGGARYGGTLAPNVYYRVYGKYFDRDNSVRPSGQDTIDNWHMGQGGFRIDSENFPDSLLTLQGDIYDGQAAQPTASAIRLSGGNTLGRWTRTLSADSDFTLQLYYDHTHRVIPGTFAEDLNTYDLDFQYRFPVAERHDIVCGFGYRLLDDNVGNTPALAFLPAAVGRQLFSAFAQDKIAIIENRLYLTLGSKIEHNDYTGFEYEPSARVAWSPAGGRMVWGAISRAIRAPSRIDREAFIPSAPPFLLAGGSNFQSEKLMAYELGYRVQPQPRLAFSLATFYNDYDDLRSLEEVNPPASFPVVIGNGFRARSYGAELVADYRVTSTWHLRAGYDELRIHVSPKPGTTDQSSGRSEAQDPNHQFSLRSFWDLPDHFQMDAMARYVGPIANQNVPGYSELDLRVGWQPTPAWEFSVVGQNLLHSHHAEFGSATSRSEIERSVSGKATWRF